MFDVSFENFTNFVTISFICSFA